MNLYKVVDQNGKQVFEDLLIARQVTEKTGCTKKIPDREKYLINTRNVENFNQLMRKRWNKNGNQKNCRNRRIL